MSNSYVWCKSCGRGIGEYPCPFCYESGVNTELVKKLRGTVSNKPINPYEAAVVDTSIHGSNCRLTGD